MKLKKKKNEIKKKEKKRKELCCFVIIKVCLDKILYLLVYNTRPCIIRTPIFDQEKLGCKKNVYLILPTADVSQW